MTEKLYYRHNIMNEGGYQRPVTVPISMSETLTLRDQFAMAALPAMIARRHPADHWEEIVAGSYALADMMLAAREEKK